MAQPWSGLGSHGHGGGVSLFQGLSCNCSSLVRHRSLTRLGQGHKQPLLHLPARPSTKGQVCDESASPPSEEWGPEVAPMAERLPTHTHTHAHTAPSDNDARVPFSTLLASLRERRMSHVSVAVFPSSPACVNVPSSQSMRRPPLRASAGTSIWQGFYNTVLFPFCWWLLLPSTSGLWSGDIKFSFKVNF